MSLFEDGNFIYRDTFFVLFQAAERPTGEQVRKCIEGLNERHEISDWNESDGRFESMTIRSPHDSSAMDIIFVEGDEVIEQVHELVSEFRTLTLTDDEHTKLRQIKNCDARFDVFLFERTSDSGDDEMLDPGGLFLVMERLANTCRGVGVDPQSKAIL